MKKLLTLSIFFFLYLATPLSGQSLRYDATEQNKRRARKNNHIPKTYEGQVVKILYHRLDYGGALDGFIFRKPDRSLIKISVPAYLGKDVAAHLMTNQLIEVKVTGDELLLEEIFSKDLYTKRLEVELKEPINGMADIAEIKSSIGSFSIKDIDVSQRLEKYFKSSDEPIINAKVSKRIRLKGKQGILGLENGDSLYFYRTGNLEEVWNQNYVSYIRPLRNSSRYYKSPNVFKMFTGNPLYSETSGYLNSSSRALGFGNAFLATIDAQFLNLINDPAGFVSGMTATTQRSEIDTFWFDRKNAKAFMGLLEQTKNEEIQLYFQELPNSDFIRAIKSKDQIVTGNDKGWFRGDVEEYMDSKVSFKGKISEIQYTGTKTKTSFRNIVLEDSIFISVNTVIALSIAEQIKEGKEISLDGWQRKEHPSQINKTGYIFIMPHKIMIDGVTFINHSAISNSQ